MVRAAALDARRSFTEIPAPVPRGTNPVRSYDGSERSLRRVSCRVRATTAARNAIPPRSHVQVDWPAEVVLPPGVPPLVGLERGCRAVAGRGSRKRESARERMPVGGGDPPG